jgi:hypothetical protein
MDESVRNDSSREMGVSARVTDATVTRAAHHRWLTLLVDIATERVTVMPVKSCSNTLLLLV